MRPRQFLAVYEGIEPSSLPRQDSILANERIDQFLAVRTRLELATPCVTDMYSNQLNYRTKITSLSWSSPLTHRYYPYRSKAWLAPTLRLQVVVNSVFYFLKTCGASPIKTSNTTGRRCVVLLCSHDLAFSLSRLSESIVKQVLD